MTADGTLPLVDVPSPCVRNCCLDENDCCLGCYRQIDEIIRWSDMGDREKLEILARCRIRYREKFDRQK